MDHRTRAGALCVSPLASRARPVRACPVRACPVRDASICLALLSAPCATPKVKGAWAQGAPTQGALTEARGRAGAGEGAGEWVARVQSPHGEARVSAELLKRYAAQRPSRPLDALLAELVEVELLALKARAEGLDLRPEVAQARDRVAVWRYLKGDFEPSLSAENLPARYIETATRANLRLFRHPELREASHVLLTVPSPPVDGRPARPQLSDADAALLTPIAERVAEDLRAHPVTTPEELTARRATYAAWLPTGYEARVEHLGRFSLEGPYVRPFAEACFALREPGAITPPFRTEFGVHVARVSDVIPAKHTSDEEIEREVRARLVSEVRAIELQRALAAEREGVEIWVEPAHPEGAP